MPSTVTVFTKHFTATGANARGAWVRNDFRTEDGQKFSTFDAGIASQAIALLEQPVTVEYETDNPQYPTSHTLKGVAAANGAVTGTGTTAAVVSSRNDYANLSIKPVDRNAGLARAIEFCSVTGENLKEAYEDGSLFELADVFATYGALDIKPVIKSETPTV